MRSVLSIILCLITALASTPGLAIGSVVSAEQACTCHRACCSAPAPQEPAKPAPAAPASKDSSDGWKYQADATVLTTSALPKITSAAELPMTEATLLERAHEVPLFVQHCCPRL